MAVRRILTSIALIAITCANGGAALGSPRSDPTTGRAVFTGSTMPHATSLSLDPASLGLGVATEFYVAVMSVVDQVGIDTQTVDVTTGAFTNGPRVRDTRFGPGGMVAVVGHPNDRLTLAGELRLPPPELHPEGEDALRYITLGGGQRTLLATVGVSLKVTDELFFGASLSHQNTFLHLRYARDTALDAGRASGGIASDCGGAPCGVGNPQATEVYDVNVRSPYVATSNLGLNIGLTVRVAPDVWIGAAYHTPPGFDIQSNLDGAMDVTRAPRDGGNVLHGGSTVSVSYPASVDGEVRARLPHDSDLHVGGRWEDLSRMRAYDVRGYGSTFSPAGIPEWNLRPRGMHDDVAVWAGAEQIDTKHDVLRLGARLGFETSSVDDAHLSPLTVAPAAFTVDVGAQARLVKGSPWSLQISYGVALSPGTTVTQSAFDPRHRLDCQDSELDYTSEGCDATRNGYAESTAAGHYTKIEHALRIGLRYELPP